MDRNPLPTRGAPVVIDWPVTVLVAEPTRGLEAGRAKTGVVLYGTGGAKIDCVVTRRALELGDRGTMFFDVLVAGVVGLDWLLLVWQVVGVRLDAR